MSDRRLQVFHAVARHKSFTRAAEQLCMTQPAVTFQVKQLEQQFNVRLFERNHGRVTLTQAGRLVLDYAERILRLSGEMESRISELTGAMAGVLALGASMTIAEYILPQILGEFKALHPEVQARMMVANSDTIGSRVADHTLDLGFIESPSRQPGVEIEPVCDDELVLVCAPRHPLARLSTVEPGRVAAEPYVSRETGSGTREFADQCFREAGIPPEELDVIMELGSPEAIKGVVETGIAVTVMSRATVARELRLGTLTAVPLAPRFMRTLSIVHPAGKFRSRLVSAFVDFAGARMRTIQSAPAPVRNGKVRLIEGGRFKGGR